MVDGTTRQGSYQERNRALSAGNKGEIWLPDTRTDGARVVGDRSLRYRSEAMIIR